MKLLIAEDEDMIRSGMEKYIRLHTDRFEKIYLARNGQEALDIIFQYEPELMLLDVQMPVLTGIEVMQEARRAKRLPKTIILSGYEEFKYAQQALRLGAVDYLLKPSRSSDILKRLEELADEIEKVEKLPDLTDQKAHYAVERAKKYMEEHYNEELTLQAVAEAVGISHGYLSSLFNQHMECSFTDHLNRIRIEHACVYLQQNYFKNYEIAFKLGYNDEKYFSKMFKKIKGISPAEYKKKLQAGEIEL